MPEIADSTPVAAEPPPEDVLADLEWLRSALDEEVPAKALDRNLLIATWNIRAFGDLTEKWCPPRRTRPSATCTPFSP